MSVLKPTTSITRFEVSKFDEAPDNIMEMLLEKFDKNQIGDIQDGEDITWGWTKLTDQFCPMFADMSFMVANYVTVGMRIDKKVISSAVLKKEIYLAEKKFLEDNQIPKLARAQKILIKEAIVKNLLFNAPAIPATYDVVWNIDTNSLYLFTTNKLAKDILEEIMQDTFGLAVTMIFPFTMSIEHASEDTVAAIQPTAFV